MFYLCETNEHFKNSVFHTSKLALYLFPCPISLLTLTKLTLLKKQKKTKEERGFTLPLFILLYSLQYYLFFLSLICVFFFNFNSILQHYIYGRLCFIIFLIHFYKVIPDPRSGPQVWRVNSIDLTFFILFLIDFFCQFHHLTLSWLKIRFCDLFRFAFDEIISISWLESRGCRVNPGLPKLFFVVLFFIEFYFSTLGWLGIELHNLSQFYFIVLSWSHNSSHEFNKLTWVDSNHFLGIFFINFFYFILQH
jgi:hypothetical protein